MSFNLYGPINMLGYGIFTRGLISGLLGLGKNDFKLDVIGQAQLESQHELQNIQPLISNNMWTRKNPSCAIWHEFDLNKFSGDKLIAFPIFETDEFAPIAVNYLKQMDAVFVASGWAKKVVEANIGNNVPVSVVPAAANIIETPEVLTTQKFKAFTFLHVGKFEQRKSTMELIKAYVMAFSGSKTQTRLICHCINPFYNNFPTFIANTLKSAGLNVMKTANTSSIVATSGSCIVEVPVGRVSEMQLSQLYRACHVGVFPSKAEGWNLPLMECLQSGLPCIATEYSAHTEYLNSNFEYDKNLLISDLVMSTANDGMFFKGDRGRWAIFKVEDLAEKMRYAYNNYNSIIEQFNPAPFKETFTWENMAKKFLEAITAV